MTIDRQRLTADEIAAIVREHTQPIPERPEGFDPLKAEAHELRHYGLPPNPGVDDSAAYRLWLDLVVPYTIHILAGPPGFGPNDYRLTPFMLSPNGRQETSDNWSGIAIAADAGESYDVITCRIHVPLLTAPPTPAIAFAPHAPKALAVSTWLGFDGMHGTSNSMPQIGITQSYTWVPQNPPNPLPGTWTLTITAWWQWWMRGTTTSVNLVSLPVKQGDVVNCWLVRTSPYSALGLMTNGIYTTGPFVFAPELASNPTPDPALGRTAEWIAERPMKPLAFLPPNPAADIWCKLYPLPQFDWVQFTDCLVLEDAGGFASLRALRPWRSLRMIEPFTAPISKSVVHSRAKLDGPYSFRVGPAVGRTWP